MSRIVESLYTITEATDNYIEEQDLVYQIEEKIKKAISPYVVGLRAALENNSLFRGPIRCVKNDYWSLETINNTPYLVKQDVRYVSGYQPSYINYYININNLDDIIIEADVDADEKESLYLHVIKHPKSLKHGLEDMDSYIMQKTSQLIKQVSKFLGNEIASKIKGIVDVSNPGHYAHGNLYVLFELDGKYYWFEAYNDGAYTGSTSMNITKIAEIEDPSNLKYISDTKNYSVVNEFSSVEDLKNSLNI